MGRVKNKGSGKARMTLSKRSFVRLWNNSLDAVIDYVKTQCKKPFMELKMNKTSSKLYFIGGSTIRMFERL